MAVAIRRSFRLLWRWLFCWVALAAILAGWPTAMEAARSLPVYLHFAMKSRAKLPKTLILLRPTTELSVGGTLLLSPSGVGSRNALVVKDSEELSDQYVAFVANTFSQSGWQVDKDTFAGTSIAGHTEVRNAVAFLRERHARMVFEMISRPNDVTKGKFTFGRDVAAIGANPQADALLLVHVQAVEPSKVPLFLRMLGGGRIVGQTMSLARISIVDTVTGDVLCFIPFLCNYYDTKYIQKTLAKIPQ